MAVNTKPTYQLYWPQLTTTDYYYTNTTIKFEQSLEKVYEMIDPKFLPAQKLKPAPPKDLFKDERTEKFEARITEIAKELEGLKKKIKERNERIRRISTARIEKIDYKLKNRKTRLQAAMNNPMDICSSVAAFNEEASDLITMNKAVLRREVKSKKYINTILKQTDELETKSQVLQTALHKYRQKKELKKPSNEAVRVL